MRRFYHARPRSSHARPCAARLFVRILALSLQTCQSMQARHLFWGGKQASCAVFTGYIWGAGGAGRLLPLPPTTCHLLLGAREVSPSVCNSSWWRSTIQRASNAGGTQHSHSELLPPLFFRSILVNRTQYCKSIHIFKRGRDEGA